MSSEAHIIYFLNYIKPEIKHIFFLGRTWGICLQDRQLGWRKLKYLSGRGLFRSDINFFTKKSCIEIVDNEIDYPWFYTGEDDIYQLSTDYIIKEYI
jgi:hypothetical protein